MMQNKFPIFGEVYGGYKDDGENHLLRLIFFAIFSIFIAFFSVDIRNSSLPSMALTVSVLAGFTFTALFSDQYLSAYDLPKIKNESDRADIDNLNSLLVNFKDRSRLFIFVSVIDLVLIVVSTLKINLPNVEYFNFINIYSINSHNISTVIYGLLLSVTLFLFFELLHVFYRLSETALSIIDIRSKYLKGRQGG